MWEKMDTEIIPEINKGINKTGKNSTFCCEDNDTDFCSRTGI